MYAAIEDPSNQVDLYTSGSETYAQIQPQETVVVSVEINTLPTISSNISPPIQTPVTPIVVNHVSFANQPTNVPSSMVSSPRHSIVNDESSAANAAQPVHSRQGTKAQHIPAHIQNRSCIQLIHFQHRRLVAPARWAIWAHRNRRSVRRTHHYHRHRRLHIITIKAHRA